jgi:hypothetical protein
MKGVKLQTCPLRAVFRKRNSLSKQVLVPIPINFYEAVPILINYRKTVIGAVQVAIKENKDLCGNWGNPCPNPVKNLKVVGTILITIHFEQKSVCQLFEK